jgi:hypothetical protein
LDARARGSLQLLNAECGNAFIAAGYAPLCRRWDTFNGVRSNERYPQTGSALPKKTRLQYSDEERRNRETDNYRGER